MSLLFPSLFLDRVRHFDNALPLLPPQMLPHLPRHSRVNAIPDRTDDAEDDHRHPNAQTDATIPSLPLCAPITLRLPQAGARHGRPNARSDHKEGRKHHHEEESDAHGEREAGWVPSEEEMGVQRGDGVEKGEAGDEEGLEDLAEGDVVHLHEPGGAQADEGHADDAEDEDDGGGVAGESGDAGPARVAMPGEVLVGEGVSEAGHS